MDDLNEIEYAIRNYHWMIKEITRLESELSMINVRMTSTIGDQGSQPKLSKKDQTLSEVIQRDRKQITLERFKKKVDFVDRFSDVITDDRELTVLTCLMDGLNVIQISDHMGFGRRTIYRIKEEIVKKIRDESRRRGS